MKIFTLCALAMASTMTFATQLQPIDITVKDNTLHWTSFPASEAQNIFTKVAKLPGQDSFNQITIGKVTTAQLTMAQIEQASTAHHQDSHRCGGLYVQTSLPVALAEMNILASNEISINSLIEPELVERHLINDASDWAATNVPLLEQSNIIDLASDFSNLVDTRKNNEPGGVVASNWLFDTWSNMTASHTDITVTQYEHLWTDQSTVIATIEGSDAILKDEIVIIGAHIDSIANRSMNSDLAPGADDNASGVATITEIMRVLSDTNYKPLRTIQFMGIAGEENGFLGSGEISRAYKNAGVNVLGMLNLDMTLYKGGSKDIYFVTDLTDVSQNQLLKSIIDDYLPDVTYGETECGYGCSDHYPFHEQGFPASFPFEAPYEHEEGVLCCFNPNLHLPSDTVENGHIDQPIKFAQMGLLFAYKMGGNDGEIPSCSISEPCFCQNPVNADHPSCVVICEIDEPCFCENPDNVNEPSCIEEPTTTVLVNGGAVSLSLADKEMEYFTIDVPENTQLLSIATTSQGNGDADLYLQYGAEPTTSVYDCRGYTSSSNEECTIDEPQVGTYHVMVHAFDSFDDLSLIATYAAVNDCQASNTCPIDCTETPEQQSCSNDTGLNESNLSSTEKLTFTLDVEAGKTLKVQTLGGTGDVDLFVKFGEAPVMWDKDCGSSNSDTNELCTIEATQMGSYYIVLSAWGSFEGVTLTATAE
ncbi:M20/M25/M40 family metallo-hydrolase [Colwellia psychrerythraea]|uniref:Leucyl aminopeptidase n=1 Tax=Colwellia psychrerythraea TaxID=28229 RepID=A0A099KNH9_COLPS|nr:M20/M25/M40 family metallo-hydrolase [Colwellia psychrerythraea]KGJ91173.1 leucyl aminopeptidase [Colwellia psychrerythraea]